MPLYECSQCHCIENTAPGEYWSQQFDHYKDPANFHPKCSECLTGKWHGLFPKNPAVGMLIDERGFLHDKREDRRGIKIVGIVPDNR